LELVEPQGRRLLVPCYFLKEPSSVLSHRGLARCPKQHSSRWASHTYSSGAVGHVASSLKVGKSPRRAWLRMVLKVMKCFLLWFKPHMCLLAIWCASVIKGRGNGTACGLSVHRAAASPCVCLLLGLVVEAT
jgi:hypothetical protein